MAVTRDPPTEAATALGGELRRLRKERGLSQRAVTRLLGLSAHSNIADYENGRRIPPRDIVTQLESLLQLTDGHLLALHARALAQRALPPTRTPSEPPPVRVRAERRTLRLVGGASLVAVGLLVAMSDVRPARSTMPASAPAATAWAGAVWDGNDPKAAGCADDAVTWDSKPVMVALTVRTPAEARIGTLVLRYSPRCAAAWGKFEPVATAVTAEAVRITIETVRPVDGMRTVFEFPRWEQTYGDVLLIAPGCVRAAVTITAGGGLLAKATTDCRPSIGRGEHR